MLAGNLSKMRTAFAEPIKYELILGEERIDMNQLIGSKISLSFNGNINCVDCGKLTKKSFGQGFCYNCFVKSPMNAECIIRPELCQAHLGKGRDVEWEKAHHLQPHLVYLAFTDVAKVGVTRIDQVPTRWIDQGASKAIILAETPYRQIAGAIEVAMKDFYKDKTNWRSMLKNDIDQSIDPIAVKEEALENFPEEFEGFYAEDNRVYHLQYPVIEYPTKIKSIGFDKEPEISGVLNGIKGQYLLFDNSRVLNIRNHSGYYIGLNY